MSTPSLSFSRSIFIVSAATILFALPALADSQARIVRLSDVQGSVQIDKNTGLGFERAFLNLPITQGTQVRTGDTGRAEVEFEDGSSMRLGPNTTLEFSTLGLTDAGNRISQVDLVDGMAYVNWLGKGGDEFGLTFSHEKISLDHAAHFRTEISSGVANVAVFKGEIGAEGPAGKVTVEKKKTATFNLAEDDKYTVENKVTEEPLDSWDKEASEYHDQYAKNNRAASPYGYGLSDLNYYGSYSNVPGYGMMWQPFFTGVGWDPFMDGAWGWYPGYGYMFASAYPWGWLPYRYGNWLTVPGYGWMWQPGGWNSWVNIPRYTTTTGVHVTSLVAPTTGTKTVIVGHEATPVFATSRLNAGSAGMGIPRGSLDNLSHLNHQVAKTGFAEVHSAPQFSASSGRTISSAFGEESHSSLGSSSGHETSMGHETSIAHTSSVGHSSSGGTSHH